MDGCRTPLLQRGIDAAAHHADCIEHDPGDSGSNCVTGGELRNDTTEFPPLDGTLPYLQERSAETAAYHWHAIGAPETVYERNGKRYLYIKSMHSDCENPRAINGMSGSGVWEIPMSSRLHDETVQIGTPILRGISFWQEARADDGNLAFYAHELETIADDIVLRLDEGQ